MSGDGVPVTETLNVNCLHCHAIRGVYNIGDTTSRAASGGNLCVQQGPPVTGAGMCTMSTLQRVYATAYEAGHGAFHICTIAAEQPDKTTRAFHNRWRCGGGHPQHQHVALCSGLCFVGGTILCRYDFARFRHGPSRPTWQGLAPQAT